MFDLIMLALVVGCFALTMAYASLCDHLLSSAVGEDVTS